MARTDRPYAQFNFVVDIPLEGWEADKPAGGFMEVSGLGVETTLTEYRNGNDIQNGVRKVATLSKPSDVTMKRGMMGTGLVYKWMENTRKGIPSHEDVTIKMQDESGKPVIQWLIRGAQLTKVTYGPLNATGTEIAMEEIVLGCEWIDMEVIA
jgi:phage tail-like protein